MSRLKLPQMPTTEQATVRAGSLHPEINVVLSLHASQVEGDLAAALHRILELEARVDALEKALEEISGHLYSEADMARCRDLARAALARE